MTITLDGNGISPFDEVTLSTDAASVTVDINDDSNQNICLITGSIGAATDNVLSRFQLLDASNNAIGNVKGNLASVGVTTSTAQLSALGSTNVFSGNYFSQGNLNSDSSIGGERLQFMIWVQASQNSSQPFYDVHVKLLSTYVYTSGAAYQTETGLYYQGTAVPRKLKTYWNTGNVSTASIKSYILGSN